MSERDEHKDKAIIDGTARRTTSYYLLLFAHQLVWSGGVHHNIYIYIYSISRYVSSQFIRQSDWNCIDNKTALTYTHTCSAVSAYISSILLSFFRSCLFFFFCIIIPSIVVGIHITRMQFDSATYLIFHSSIIYPAQQTRQID